MVSLKKQALVLTIANAYTRILGFVLRLMTARLMGAQALGVMEMASSAVMLAIPTAMSRLAAQRDANDQTVLRAGLSLVKRLTAWLMPGMLVGSPLIAWLLGDFRTLPSILTSLPLIGLLGLCAVYSGWFYGKGDAATPALSECVEQSLRCLLAFLLLFTFSSSSVALMAALPNVAEVAAGFVVWWLQARERWF